MHWFRIVDSRGHFLITLNPFLPIIIPVGTVVVDIVEEFTHCYREYFHIIGISSNPYLLRLVNVVKKRLPTLVEKLLT